MEISRSSPIPLYFQLKEILLNGIHRGDWKAGDKLPTEEEIQNEYHISRTTVRQALQELESEGWIIRQAGRGTFVTQPKVREGTEAFHLGLPEFQERKLQLGWKIISADWYSAPENVAAALRLRPGETVFRLLRLRIANQTPIGYATSYVPAAFAASLDMDSAEQGGSMNYLKGINLERCTAERVVEALPAEHADSEQLGIKEGSPVLVITRLLCSQEATPIEYFRGVYRGDRFQYHIQSLPAQV